VTGGAAELTGGAAEDVAGAGAVGPGESWEQPGKTTIDAKIITSKQTEINDNLRIAYPPFSNPYPVY